MPYPSPPTTSVVLTIHKRLAHREQRTEEGKKTPCRPRRKSGQMEREEKGICPDHLWYTVVIKSESVTILRMPPSSFPHSPLPRKRQFLYYVVRCKRKPETCQFSFFVFQGTRRCFVRIDQENLYSRSVRLNQNLWRKTGGKCKKCERGIFAEASRPLCLDRASKSLLPRQPVTEHMIKLL